MPEVKPNWENINKVCDRIEADPDSFDMAVYFAETYCGTVACFAGHAALEMGMVPANLRETEGVGDRDNARLAVRPWMRQDWKEASMVRYPHHQRLLGSDDYAPMISVRSVATEYLGLTDDQAEQIFTAWDVCTVEDLRLKIKEVLGDE